ncbi:copper resistance protein [Tardiphaga robiniae]|uniref:Copper resistance protein n=1 Tax=Tardiphaga robiniae TaxID=943830 RepID=A0A161QYQ8_9BRAD|nr:copper resistance protein [Tardiphaga robiniae]
MALAALLASAPVVAEADHGSHAHDETFSTGEPGDAKKPARIVQVTMTEAGGKMLFTPSRVEVRKDEQIKFVLRNSGELDHEFVLATTEENLKHAESMKKAPDMEHDDPNAKKLAPKKTGDLVWKFTKAGEFEYSCLIPGHREAGMIGTVVVK